MSVNPVEIVGHSGLDGTERVIIDAERLTRTGEDALSLARYLTTGNDAGAVAYSADAGGWTLVRDTVTGSTLALYMNGVAKVRRERLLAGNANEGQS